MGFCISKPVCRYPEHSDGTIDRVDLHNPTIEERKRAGERKALLQMKGREGNMQVLKRGESLITNGPREYKPFAIVRKRKRL